MLYENALGVLTVPLHTVATTSLTKLREDVDELRRSWATALSSLSFFAMPAFGILAVTAPDVVVLLLGEKWAPAGWLLSIFAFRGIAHIVERTLGWLHVAAGRSDRWLRWGVASSVVQLGRAGLRFAIRPERCRHRLQREHLHLVCPCHFVCREALRNRRHQRNQDGRPAVGRLS